MFIFRIIKSLSIVVIAMFGIIFGKTISKNKNLIEQINDTKQTQIRRSKRDLDSDDSIRQRMQKFTRPD
jgi:hypothetical protein